MVSTFVLLWTLFWKLKETNALPRITIYDLFWIIVASNLDGLGYELGLWGYTYKLSPFLPKSYVFDYCLIPITYMLIYQYFPTGKSFFCANVILAFGASFVAEPVAEKLGLYIPFHWNFFISIPLYIIIAYILKFFTEIICRFILQKETG
ncbi:CBO0543 family protein [Bacillus sp. LL01]|uniref:CBO0543 family protein n=1 Tax=Bacillus sp. LL01 TaxID=1665556 RepID=UPI00069EBFD3|nr:CBO0543 family protein [Bacillus sp. LL01]